MPDDTEKPRRPGVENLIPTNQRTKEEARDLGAIGGKKSGEVRREKKKFRTLYAEVLAKEYEINDETLGAKKLTGDKLIVEVIGRIIAQGGAPSVSMIKEMREAIDGEKIKHTGLPGLSDLAKMTPEELQRAQDEFLVKNAERIERLKKEAEERLNSGATEEREEE